MEKIKQFLRTLLLVYVALGVVIGGIYALRQWMLHVPPAPAAPAEIQSPFSTQ
jgi:hypothetical protein